MKLPASFDTPETARSRKVALVLVVLTLPFFLGAWKITIGRDINPAYVERIQDGKTPKHEILTLFGDPDEIDRTPEAVVYVYKSYRNQTTPPKRGRQVKSAVQDSPYFREDWLEKKKARERESSANKELASKLIIRFDQEGQTVQSHDYQQF